MKIAITIILSTFLTNFLVGQNTLQGQASDSINSSVDYLRILLSNNEKNIASTYTDEMGKFSLDVPQGTYTLFIKTLMGDTLLTKKNLEIKGSVDLGILQIKSLTKEIEGVLIEVKRKLIIRKPDRLVFNVEYSLAANRGNLIDVLSVTPGVRVRSSEISVIGKSTVLIMINNQLIRLSGDDLMNFLRSIPSEEIANIEVINNPPSKYDAEGNSGLINVNLKSSKSKGWNCNIRASFAQASHSGGSTGGNINYFDKKFSMYGSLNLGEGSIAPSLNKTIYYSDKTWIEDNRLRSYQAYLNGRVGLNYQCNPKSQFTLQYQGALGNPFTRENITMNVLNVQNNSSDSILRTNAQTKVNNINHDVNAYYKYDLDTVGKNISFNMNYFSYENLSNRLFLSKTYLSNDIYQNERQTQNNVKQNIGFFTSKVDLVLPYSFADMSVGGKITQITNRSNVEFYNKINENLLLDTLQTSEFVYSENTQAIYFSVLKELNEWQVQAGLRGEYTQTKGVSKTVNQVNKNEYLQLFPSVDILYMPNDNNAFALNYGRRIDRPQYWRQNPFRQYSSAFAYSEGNPMLQPSFINSIEASYTWQDKFISAIYYARGTNKYDQITYVSSSTNMQTTVQKNFLTVSSFGISESFTYTKMKWWESNNEFMVYMNTAFSQDPATLSKVSGISAFASTKNSFVLNKKKTFSGEVNFLYQFPEVDGIENVGNYSALEMGFRLKLLEKKLTISCRISDILRTDLIKIQTEINSIEQRNLKYWDVRQLNISINYSLGNSKKERQIREESNEEEKGRIN